MHVTTNILVYIVEGVYPKQGSGNRLIEPIREAMEYIYGFRMEHYEVEGYMRHLKKENPFWYRLVKERIECVKELLKSDNIQDLVSYYNKISYNVYNLDEIFSLDYSRSLEFKYNNEKIN